MTRAASTIEAFETEEKHISILAQHSLLSLSCLVDARIFHQKAST